MATTSIWDVKGYLGRVLIYAENPEKTENPKFYQIEGTADKEVQGLADVMAYATDPTKTEQKMFVTGINCRPETARDEMLSVKRGYEKDGGIIAWHGYQSFKPGETTPETAHEIGVKLAREVFGERFQVIVATHLDRGHLHNHIVLNSVSFADGIRYHRTEKDYYKLQSTSDRLCSEYGLSVIKDPKRGKAKHYAEWNAEREGKETWRSVIRSGVDECITKAKSERDFFSNLEALGYEYKIGKDISVRPAGKERFFRLERNFGDAYTIDGIRERIRAGRGKAQILPVATKRPPAFKSPKKLPPFARGSIVALHRHYLYLMGYYERHGNPATNARTHYLLRDDLRKLDEYVQDTKLLEREGIDDAKGLSSLKHSHETEIDRLQKKRTELKNAIRAEAGYGNRYSTKDNPEYLQLNQRLKTLRKEVVQLKRIEERSHSLVERIERIERDEDKKLSQAIQRGGQEKWTQQNKRQIR